MFLPRSYIFLRFLHLLFLPSLISMPFLFIVSFTFEDFIFSIYLFLIFLVPHLSLLLLLLAFPPDLHFHIQIHSLPYSTIITKFLSETVLIFPPFFLFISLESSFWLSLSLTSSYSSCFFSVVFYFIYHISLLYFILVFL